VLVLPSGQKLTFGLLASITLNIVPFHANAPFPALLLFLNASWKLCSMRVFSTACDYLDHFNCVKMVAFHFYFQSGEAN
jgi:hypothetical protein